MRSSPRNRNPAGSLAREIHIPSAPIDADRLKRWIFPEIVQSYTARDTILYALALGIGAMPDDPRQLRHVYERNLVAFPTLATTLCFDGPWTVPDSGIDLTRILHGEQAVTMYQTLSPSATVRARECVTDLVDTGEDAIIHSRRDLFDQVTGACIATLQSSLYCRGQGGFGGMRKPSRELTYPLPPRVADDVVEIPTLAQTALLYRLCGDPAPLHVDPEFAWEAGFPRPIMHGLCTFGIAAFAVVTRYADLDARHLKSVRTRFCAPVYPGETLTFELWTAGEAVWFRAWAKNRGIKVLDRGHAILARHDPFTSSPSLFSTTRSHHEPS